MKHRACLRGYSLAKIEEILRYSGERYYDTATGRALAVGKHDDRTVIIPYEENEVSHLSQYTQLPGNR